MCEKDALALNFDKSRHSNSAILLGVTSLSLSMGVSGQRLPWGATLYILSDRVAMLSWMHQMVRSNAFPMDDL